jgi:hypothetical protein
MNNSALGGSASLPLGIEYAPLGIEFVVSRFDLFAFLAV